MYKKIVLLVLLISVLVLGGIFVSTTSGEKDKVTQNDETTQSTEIDTESETELQMEQDTVEVILESMTLEEKVYQMFIITPEQLTGVETVVAAGETTQNSLESYPVGGLVYFAKNLIDTEQTKTMLSNTQAYANEVSGLPLFLCVDEEGGRVARIANNESFGVTNVGPMSNITAEEEAYQTGATIGTYLLDLGFNFDFAPDADVITNTENQVIGDRSFGTDAETVKSLATEMSKGLQNSGVMSTFKHFPGHGATEGDTHEGFAYTTKTYAELKQSELVPFAEAENAGVDAVMVAHISLPNVIGDNTPCTLSYKAVTEILREDLGYNGLIVTDAMNMGAIVNIYGADEAAVRAVQAGVDIILMPEDFQSASAAIIDAIENGTISEERIDASVRRILEAKSKWM